MIFFQRVTQAFSEKEIRKSNDHYSQQSTKSARLVFVALKFYPDVSCWPDSKQLVYKLF